MYICTLKDVMLIHNIFEFDSKYGVAKENVWTYQIGTLLECFANQIIKNKDYLKNNHYSYYSINAVVSNIYRVFIVLTHTNYNHTI